MNEAETRAELIDPKLKQSGWGVVEGSKILRERQITDGRIQIGGGRKKKLIVDYLLQYKGINLAVIEAKSDKLSTGEGVAQAKLYAQKLQLDYTYATNGKDIYQINLKTGEEKWVDAFPTPDELWQKVFSTEEFQPKEEAWFEKFMAVPFHDKSGSWQPRYYQEIAIKNTLLAVSKYKKRILLNLATGTGKTAIAFQIAWKMFQTRWNLSAMGDKYQARRPRILFLADRNILANQAFNAFSAFPEDAMVRIRPGQIRKKGKVPTNGSIFFTIFQTFMSGTDENGQSQPYFGEYPEDFFDLIIVDECHRGGANDESTWRAVLEYFSPAVQLGLTATPKRDVNVDTYRYFGEPVYSYSLKEGINDGFLTPFKVKRVYTTLDEYVYTNDDEILEGEVEEGKIYKEKDFNRTIEIKAREKKRVEIFMNDINQKDKSLVFCANQAHAALIRDLINQVKINPDPNYCVRVTANDGEMGEQFLRDFQDNEKNIPTILTTSQKLSTGVDARNVRNIVLLRPVNSMVEFKQIVGRGTRLYEGKEFFTIYDFVNAYHHFADPEWDGEPLEPETVINDPATPKEPKNPVVREPDPVFDPTLPPPEKIRIKLADGKEREIQHMIATSFWSTDGRPISAQEFLQNLFGELPKLFKNEEELRKIWSHPQTRKILLQKLDDAGFGQTQLASLKKIINADNSDLFDVLEYVFNSDIKPVSRAHRAQKAKEIFFPKLTDKQKEFIDFVLNKYIEVGISELDREKLPILLKSKYDSIEDAINTLGDVNDISQLFTEFQKYLYEIEVA